MEEFRLGPLLSRDELNIINQQDIHSSELISKFIHLLIAEGIDQFIRELF